MVLIVALVVGLLIGSAIAQILRTKRDRRTLEEHGVDVGPPWSGRCVSTRVVDLASGPDASLDLAGAAIVAIKGSGVVVDRNTWSATGWTGTHLGAYGSQVGIFLTQLDPTVVRLNCYCRPRSKTTAFTLGTMSRRTDRLVAQVHRIASAKALELR
jgi:hypothetical protein